MLLFKALVLRYLKHLNALQWYFDKNITMHPFCVTHAYILGCKHTTYVRCSVLLLKEHVSLDYHYQRVALLAVSNDL